MTSVLQLTRKMIERPVPAKVAGVHLRNYQGPQDIEVWLDLRRRAFARQQLGVRDWNAAEFGREFLEKDWWQPGAVWFAESQPLLMPSSPVGSVTLARRGVGNESKPVVHWLLVLPKFRNRGIGRLLMATLEAAVWDTGGRQVWLETHVQWAEAARLYQALGYRPVDE